MGRHRLSVEDEARALVERLGGRWSSNGGMCRCPAHVDRTPSLSVRPGRTRLLLHCFAGCTATEVLRALETAHLFDPAAPRDKARPGRAHHAHNSAALQIWETARSIEGTPVAHYFAARGLETHSPELRFHSRAPHGPQPLTRYRPAMIAAVRDDCGLVGIHRTFLDLRLQGRAGGRSGLGRFGRGAVRFGGCASRVGLAEGIETALSATALFNVPCWAALGAERFAVVSLPSEIAELHLFLDHDSGGKRAELLAREAFAEVPRIETHYPERRGDDWNDVLRRARV
jgi:putative DNA primase/helicase